VVNKKYFFLNNKIQIRDQIRRENNKRTSAISFLTLFKNIFLERTSSADATPPLLGATSWKYSFYIFN